MNTSTTVLLGLLEFNILTANGGQRGPPRRVLA